MILHDVVQGDPEWFAVRMGIPTASQFHRVLTPKKGELAEGRWSYAYELAAERLLNESKETIDSLQWVERGKLLEPDAVNHFRLVKRLKVAKAGFITTDDRRWGCSPDMIVYDGDPPDLTSEEAWRTLGGLEVKCPMAATHIRYFIDGLDAQYRCQYQGSLLVSGFSHWWFESYYPSLPQFLVRMERDEPFIEKLASALDQFCDEIEMICEKIKAAGYVPPPGAMRIPIDQLADMMDKDPNLWAMG